MSFFEQYPEHTQEFREQQKVEYRRNRALARKRREKEEIRRRGKPLSEILPSSGVDAFQMFVKGFCHFCENTEAEDVLIGVCAECAKRSVSYVGTVED